MSFTIFYNFISYNILKSVQLKKKINLTSVIRYYFKLLTSAIFFIKLLKKSFYKKKQTIFRHQM